MSEIDPIIIGAIAAGAVILLVVLFFVFRKKSPPQDGWHDDLDDLPEADFDDPHDEPIVDPRQEKKEEKKRKKEMSKISGGCDHHFEIKGFPADKMGTHYLIVCDKCGFKKEVPINDAASYLAMRDDVRQAVTRARSRNSS